MTAVALLDELRRRGIEVGAEGDRLRLHAPTGAVDASIRDRVVTHKASILALLREGAEPSALRPDPARAHEPFALNDIQQAYWIGRSKEFELGNIGTHTYLEFERAELDPQRLSAAWRQTVARHPMLRAVVDRDGMQRVLVDVPAYEIAVDDLLALPEDEALARVAATRDRLSHQLFDDAVWPLFELRISALADGWRVHVSGEVLIADASSWQLIFRDWGRFYEDPDVRPEPLELTFRDYSLAEPEARGPAARDRDERYWRKQAATLPPGPELPLARSPAEIAEPRFTRHQCRIDRMTWEHVKRRAAAEGLTPSVALLTAYAAVLAGWSRHPRFTLNLTLFDRLPLHPQVGEIVGDFTSFTLLDVDAGLATFGELAASLQAQLHERMEHTALSGVEAVRIINRERGAPARGATAPVVFTSLVNSAGDMMAPFAWLGTIAYSITQTPQVWLDHQVFEDGGDLVANWDVVDGLLAEGVVEGMLGAWEGLVGGLVSGAGWVGGVGVLAGGGVGFNATDGVVSGGLLQDGFLACARCDGDAVAVVGERVLGYGELERRSAAVAGLLVGRGVGRGSLVGVVMEKGWEQVVGVLGVVRAGGAYVPVDPGWPAERRALVLEQCGVSVVLTQSWLAGSLEWSEGVGVLAVDVVDPLADGVLGEGVDGSCDGSDLAYVIFTSGSTGRPKGVAVDHRGALNTVSDVNARFGLCASDRVLGVSALTFDLSVWDVFGTLAAGGALVLPEAGAARDPAHWCELIVEHGVTVWNSAPALMGLVVEYAESVAGALGDRLRLVLLSGDWIAVGLADRVRALRDGVRVVSLGGATEASIWSIVYEIGEVDASWRSIPYGRPLANQHVYVLDGCLRERPDHVVGEIYIGGVGVAVGYYADGERTAQRFVVHPRSGERLYRTGDLGRYLPAGVIEFLGREDFQVKVQGYRIELEEVETVLAEHRAVRQVVVTAVGERDGARHLAAHVVARDDAGPDIVAQLRAHAAAKLPAYMTPHTYALLDALPLTANGKIDRTAIHTTTRVAPQGAPAAEAESSAVADRVLALVRDVLEQPEAGVDDDLMRLGATSLHLVRLANALELAFGTRPPLSGSCSARRWREWPACSPSTRQGRATAIGSPASSSRAGPRCWPTRPSESGSRHGARASAAWRARREDDSPTWIPARRRCSRAPAIGDSAPHRFLSTRSAGCSPPSASARTRTVRAATMPPRARSSGFRSTSRCAPAASTASMPAPIATPRMTTRCSRWRPAAR